MEENITVSENGNSTSEEIFEVPDVDATKVCVMSAIIIMTVFGNVCIMACILGHRSNMMARRTYFYMLHLSIADIITAFLTLLPELIWTVTSPNFYGGNFVCKSVKFLQMVGPYLSSYVLVMMAVDRYLAICFPLTNPAWTSTESKQMIIVAWFISLLLCVPQAFIFRISTEDPLNCRAVFQPEWGVKAYVTWFSFSNFFIPLLVLVFCYVQICHEIWKSISLKPVTVANLNQKHMTSDQETNFMIKNGNGGNPDELSEDHQLDDNDPNLITKDKSKTQNGHKNPISIFKVSTARKQSKVQTRIDDPDYGLSRAKIRSVKQTVVIILTYVGCSTPFIFAQLWVTWGNPGEGISHSIIWLFWLLTLNSVMNPWIYVAFNRELRLLVFGWRKTNNSQNDFTTNQRSYVNTNRV